MVSCASCKTGISLLLSLLIFGCDGGNGNQDVHSKAKSLGLEERYDYYIEVYNSRIPRNTDVAEDIVSLGEPARKYVFSKIDNSNDTEFGAILSVIYKFGNKCSNEEFKKLSDKAETISTSFDQLDALRSRVSSTCRFFKPAGIK